MPLESPSDGPSLTRDTLRAHTPSHDTASYPEMCTAATRNLHPHHYDADHNDDDVEEADNQ